MPAFTLPHRLLGVAAAAAAIFSAGCRMADTGRGAWNSGWNGLVPGAATGGAETEALLVPVRDAVATLLARHVPSSVVQASLQTAEDGRPAAKRIAIVPINAATAAAGDDLGPRIGAIVQQRIDESDAFEAVAPRFVAAGLEAARLRPEDLRGPERRRTFAAFLEQQGQDVDYLLVATVEPAAETGATRRDRVLTLTLVDAADGSSDECRKTLPAATWALFPRLDAGRRPQSQMRPPPTVSADGD